VKVTAVKARAKVKIARAKVTAVKARKAPQTARKAPKKTAARVRVHLPLRRPQRPPKRHSAPSRIRAR
jgi:hypothetical protein